MSESTSNIPVKQSSENNSAFFSSHSL